VPKSVVVSRGHILAALVSFACMTVTTPSLADPVFDSIVGARTLRGHTFLRPTGDDSAFLVSTVGFRQGLLFVDAGDVTVLKRRMALTQAAAIESLDASFRVVDWFALGATADLQALLAASEAATYSTASQVAGGIRFGPAFRLARIAATGTQITLRPYYQATFGAILDVRHVFPALRDRLLDEIEAANGQLPPGAVGRALGLEADVFRSAVVPLRRGAWGGSLHVANTITPELGIQLAYGLRRERFAATAFDLADRSESTQHFHSVTHSFNATLSLDGARIGVPIAALFEVVVTASSFTSELDGRSRSTPATMLLGPGLYYTGRPYLQLGVHVATELGLERFSTPYGDSGRPSAHYGQFTLRQFF